MLRPWDGVNHDVGTRFGAKTRGEGKSSEKDNRYACQQITHTLPFFASETRILEIISIILGIYGNKWHSPACFGNLSHPSIKGKIYSQALKREISVSW